MEMRAHIVALFLVLCCTLPPASAVFFGRRIQQLCVNAVGINPAIAPPGTVIPPGSGTQVTCVNCDAARIQYISAICTGQPVVPPNIQPNQAFCLINNCLQQLPQKNALLPSFGGTGMMAYAGNNSPIGRRKRSAGTQAEAEPIRTTVDSGGNEFLLKVV